MSQVSNTKKLLSSFIEKAKSLNENVKPIKILRSNTFNVGNANVLVRIASDLEKRYFFGLNYINAEEIYNLDNSFIAFICGDLNKIIFMPTDILVKNLPNISHDRNGEYKINFTRDLRLVLKGRGNQLDCSEFVKNWGILQKSNYIKTKFQNAVESIHTIIQGRLLEIGNIRGYHTYCPDKSKTFNKIRLDEIAILKTCPKLQFTEYDCLRNIDALWFRKTDGDFYPEYAFEVEFSTGVWSGFGRLATLREFNTKLFIVTHDSKRFGQILNTFPEVKDRYINIIPENIGLLYSAEKNLIQMRRDFNI